MYQRFFETPETHPCHLVKCTRFEQIKKVKLCSLFETFPDHSMQINHPLVCMTHTDDRDETSDILVQSLNVEIRYSNSTARG